MLSLFSGLLRLRRLFFFPPVCWVLAGTASRVGNCNRSFDAWLESAVVAAPSESSVEAVGGDMFCWVSAGIASGAGNGDRSFDAWLESALVTAPSGSGVESVGGVIEGSVASCAREGGMRAVSCDVTVSSVVVERDERAASALMFLVCGNVGRVGEVWVIV